MKYFICCCSLYFSQFFGDNCELIGWKRKLFGSSATGSCWRVLSLLDRFDFFLEIFGGLEVGTEMC
jgi:hypothetical protein